ncbi:MAG: hypothetical protein J6A03_09945 [Lachnospiraceae bacterium]|nr:hypothetical protein [Lachnospiraceae bacterium]
MKISEIANILDYDYIGEDCDIVGIAYSNEASERDIAVIRSKSEIPGVRSKVLLTRPILIPISKTLIVTYDDIGYAINKICDILIQRGLKCNYSLPVKFAKTNGDYYVGQKCNIANDTTIYPNVYIGNDVSIGHGCIIEPNVVIGSGTEIKDHVTIGSGSRIGADSFYHYYDELEIIHQFSGIGKTIIEENVRIGCNCIVQRGTISNTYISRDTVLGNGIDVGHDVKLGKNCKVVSQTGIAGNVKVKDNVIIYGQVGISNDVVVGKNVVVKAKTLVSKSIEDNKIVFGMYGREYDKELRIASKLRREYGRKEE